MEKKTFFIDFLLEKVSYSPFFMVLVDPMSFLGFSLRKFCKFFDFLVKFVHFW